jgi:hypothetical protein
VPLDGFSVEPLRYRPDGDSFILYSVGENLIDDGGRTPAPADEDDADVVFWPPSAPAFK